MNEETHTNPDIAPEDEEITCANHRQSLVIQRSLNIVWEEI